MAKTQAAARKSAASASAKPDKSPTAKTGLKVEAHKADKTWQKLKNAAALIRFREESYQYLFHDVRVFVQGAEVSNWLTGSLSINLTEKDGQNVASFTLDNAFDRFVITEENLGIDPDSGETGTPQWRLNADPAHTAVSERAKYEIFLYKIGEDKAGSAELKVDKAIGNMRSQMKALSTRANLIRRVARKYNLPTTAGYEATDAAEMMWMAMQQVPDRLWRNPETAEKLKQAAIQAATKTSLLKRNGKTARLTSAQAEEVAEKYADAVSTATRNPKAMPDAFRKIMARVQQQQLVPEAQEQNYEIFRSDAVVSSATLSDGKTKRRVVGTAEGSRKVASQGKKNPTDRGTGDPVWSLSAHSCILDKNDPVRIFLRNPYTENADQWFFAFTGYVDIANVQRDYITGESSIAVNCYDIRTLMGMMRVSFTPIIAIEVKQAMFQYTNGEVQRQGGSRDSLFADLVSPSHFSQPFASMRLEEAAAVLVTGGKTEGVDTGGTKIPIGVGRMRRGRIVKYPAADGPTGPKSRAVLEDWHTRCFVDDYDNSVDPHSGTFLTSEEVALIGKETTSDGAWAPDRRFLHMLLPRDGTGFDTIANYSFQAGSDRRTWVTRLQILNELTGNIDYQWWVTPVGDIVLEFPMYDMHPEDFGGYAPLFSVRKHLTHGHFVDQRGPIPTALEMSGGFAFTDVGPKLPEGVMPRIVVQSSTLMAKWGVNVQTDSRPFIDKLETLQCIALLEFQKRLALANEMDMSFIYRPLLCPNRPMRNDVDKRVGLTWTATTSVAIRGEVTGSLHMKYIRTWRNDGTYRHVTGSDHMPFSYRNVAQGKCGDLIESGVRVLGPSNVPNGDATKHPDIKRTPRMAGNFSTLSKRAQEGANALIACIQSTPGLPSDAKLLLNSTRRKPGSGQHSHGDAFDVHHSPDGKRLYTDAEIALIEKCAEKSGVRLFNEIDNWSGKDKRKPPPKGWGPHLHFSVPSSVPRVVRAANGTTTKSK